MWNEEESKKEAAEMADKLSRFINGNRAEIKDVVELMSRDHRTLQQGFTRLCVAWLEKCAEKEMDGYYDLRNEASVKLGKKFVDRLDASDRALPYI